jgi:hypothetical protein
LMLPTTATFDIAAATPFLCGTWGYLCRTVATGECCFQNTPLSAPGIHSFYALPLDLLPAEDAVLVGIRGSDKLAVNRLLLWLVGLAARLDIRVCLLNRHLRDARSRL